MTDIVTPDELHHEIEHALEHEALEERLEEISEAQHDSEHENIEHHVEHIEEATTPETESPVWMNQLLTAQEQTNQQLAELTLLVRSTSISQTVEPADTTAEIEIPEPEPAAEHDELESRSKPTKRLGFGLRHRR